MGHRTTFTVPTFHSHSTLYTDILVIRFFGSTCGGVGALNMRDGAGEPEGWGGEPEGREGGTRGTGGDPRRGAGNEGWAVNAKGGP
jgi:hypothetical protein